MSSLVMVAWNDVAVLENGGQMKEHLYPCQRFPSSARSTAGASGQKGRRIRAIRGLSRTRSDVKVDIVSIHYLMAP
jgi:hypothetical protein